MRKRIFRVGLLSHREAKQKNLFAYLFILPKRINNGKNKDKHFQELAS